MIAELIPCGLILCVLRIQIAGGFDVLLRIVIEASAAEKTALEIIPFGASVRLKG